MLTVTTTAMSRSAVPDMAQHCTNFFQAHSPTGSTELVLAMIQLSTAAHPATGTAYHPANTAALRSGPAVALRSTFTAKNIYSVGPHGLTFRDLADDDDTSPTPLSGSPGSRLASSTPFSW